MAAKRTYQSETFRPSTMAGMVIRTSSRNSAINMLEHTHQRVMLTHIPCAANLERSSMATERTYQSESFKRSAMAGMVTRTSSRNSATIMLEYTHRRVIQTHTLHCQS